MYGRQGLEDIIFLMLYGGTAFLAVAAGLYLLLRRNNAVASVVNSPKMLRRWTAAFFGSMALSHIWWYVLGNVWLTDDKLVRYMLTIALDRITLVPLAFAVLLRMLQDHERKLWPWFFLHIPVVLVAIWGIATRNENAQTVMRIWQICVMVVFGGYYIRCLVQYSHWLNDNYADLQNKEVWQSLLFAGCLFAVYSAYGSNMGQMLMEYLSQVESLLVVGFFLWRVETLDTLEEKDDVAVVDALPVSTINIPDNIGKLLERKCEGEKLYLQHDLNLRQLALAIGTNRTYLSSYFAQQGETYNAYINRLRINHFIRLYHENPTATALELCWESGYSCYSTFAAVFKKMTGMNVASWMKKIR
ncbi:MAG: AraC family transcriptional regulator [Bacteroidaceae bacterium]|nr:AraC family transcriptional regulator [Bacteroidaceae bacterium]